MRRRRPDNEGPGKRLSPGEVEAVLRRAAELNARRTDRMSRDTLPVSPEMLLQVASAAGIPEEHVRRAVQDLDSQESAEPDTIAAKLYGSARLRVVRELDGPAEDVRDHVEDILRREQGLKLRRSTEEGSLWDPGDALGAVRRALDFSGQRSLLKTDAVELMVEEIGRERCGANVTADVSGQRGEYLSLGALLGATLAVPVAIAGVQEPLFFLGVLPALAAPGFGFKLAYRKACAEIRRAIDELLDGVESIPLEEDEYPEAAEAEEDRRFTDRRPADQPRNLRPIPKFTPRRRDE